MKSLIALAAALAVVGTATTRARADETLSPGKNAAYTYLTGLSITTGYNQVAQVTIEKGKPKRVVEVDVQLTDTVQLAQALAAYVSVNGVQLMPGQSNIPVMTSCNLTYDNCTITNNFWADLDELELANPGVFKNQPLVFTIYGITGGANITNATLTARARMLKK